MPVLKEHKDLLGEPLSIELAGNYLEFYDNSDKLIAMHQAKIADI